MGPVLLPPQSRLGWQVSIIVVHAIAIISTIYRLVHRFRRRQTWWDDYIAFIPLVVDLGFWTLGSVQFPHLTDSNGMTVESYVEEVYGSYWLTMLPCIVILWTTRIVMALSLARVFPGKHPARRWSFILVGLISLSCIVTIAITIGTCKSGLLMQANVQACVQGVGGAPLKDTVLFAVDLLSAVLLIVSPLIICWRLSLPRNNQRLILMVSCGGFLILLSAIAFIIVTDNHVISFGPYTAILFVGMGGIEAAISLFVCNLPVILICLSRGIRDILHLESPDPESTAESAQHSSRSCSCCSDVSPTPLTLTEISDLSFPSNPPSERSLGISHSSSQAARESYYHSDEEITEKQRSHKSDSETDLEWNKPS